MPSVRDTLAMLAACIPLLLTQARAQPPDLFGEFDQNKDGKLTREELPEPLRDRFTQIDTDKDGFISRQEDRAFLMSRDAGRPGRGGPRGPIKVPDTVRVTRDINYAGTTNPRQTLDLLLPAKPAAEGALPVVVGIHGGAFRMGDKSMALQEVLPLVESGHYAAVVINYRLSGEALWPAQIQDCKAAVRWVRANAGEHSLDPERIGVIGGSAGGHLAAMLGVSGDVKELEGDLGPNAGVSSRVVCVVDQFGPTDFLSMDKDGSEQNHDSPGSPESSLIGGPLQENPEKARAASPISYVTKDDPPILIIHGTADPLVPFGQSVRMSKALTAAEVSVRFIPVQDAGHGGFRNPEVMKRVRQFFDAHLREVKAGEVSEEPIPNEAG